MSDLNGHQPEELDPAGEWYPRPQEEKTTTEAARLIADLNKAFTDALQNIVKVNPNDRVTLTFSQAIDQNTTLRIVHTLKQWAPDVAFMVMGGVAQIATLPPEQELPATSRLILPS